MTETAILRYGIRAGIIIITMGGVRTITIQLPAELVRKAQRSTGEGITATIRRGLELVAAGRAQEELRRLRGKVAFSVDWKKLRADQR